MQLDSKEEQYFSWWCEELEQAGYINSFSQCQTYQLGEKIINKYQETLKTKTKEKEQTIMQGCAYTPDFEINWNLDAVNKFFDLFPTLTNTKINNDLILAKIIEENNIKKFKSIIEIKGSYDFKQMNTLNAVNRKWLYQKYNIFVNLVKVPDIFKQTFTPKRYLLTDGGKQQRIINFSVITLNEFISNQIKPEIIEPKPITLNLNFLKENNNETNI